MALLKRFVRFHTASTDCRHWRINIQTSASFSNRISKYSLNSKGIKFNHLCYQVRYFSLFGVLLLFGLITKGNHSLREWNLDILFTEGLENRKIHFTNNINALVNIVNETA